MHKNTIYQIVIAFLIVSAWSCQRESDRKIELYTDIWVEKMLLDYVALQPSVPIYKAKPFRKYSLDRPTTVIEAIVELGFDASRIEEYERSGFMNIRWISWRISNNYDLIAGIPKQEKGIPNYGALGWTDTCAAVYIRKR
jgi:hypothetical protein